MKIQTNKATDKELEKAIIQGRITNEKNNEFRSVQTIGFDKESNKCFKYDLFIVVKNIEVKDSKSN